MKVLVLSPYPEKLHSALAAAGDDAVAMSERLSEVSPDIEFIVSYGYRFILKEPLLSAVGGRAVNIHISMLPWNRGADPNFWSWFDGTPKGVTIHRMDAGIDTGPVLAQREVRFGEGETLKTSYLKLHDTAVRLFSEFWPLIRTGSTSSTGQPEGPGSYHRACDKEPWWSLLPAGYDTPVSAIEDLGREHAASADFWSKYDREVAEVRDASAVARRS